MAVEWKAIYIDGSELPEYNQDGSANDYRDINRRELSQFVLLVDKQPKVILHFDRDDGKQLIYRRRVFGTDGIKVLGKYEIKSDAILELIAKDIKSPDLDGKLGKYLENEVLKFFNSGILTREDKIILRINPVTQNTVQIVKIIQKRDAVYLVGWQKKVNKKNIQMINCLFPDGHIEVIDKFRENHPCFSSIEFTPEEERI